MRSVNPKLVDQYASVVEFLVTQPGLAPKGLGTRFLLFPSDRWLFHLVGGCIYGRFGSIGGHLCFNNVHFF